MVNLPTIESRGVLTKAPQSSLTGADIAGPARAIAGALGAVGEKLEERQTAGAAQAGQDSVSRNPATGDLQVKANPYLPGSAAAEKYAHAQGVLYTSRAQNDLRAAASKAALDANGDLDNFDGWTKGWLPKWLKGQPAALRAGAEADAEQVLGQTRQGLMLQKHDRDMKVVLADTNARRTQLVSDLATLAREGGVGSNAYKSAFAQYEELSRGLIDNPDLSYSDTQYQIDKRALVGQMQAEGLVGQVDRALEKGGIVPALKLATEIEAAGEGAGLTLSERKQYGGLMRSRIADWKARKEVENAPLIDEAKNLNELFAQGLGMDNPRVDALAAELNKGGMPSEAAKLISNRDLFKHAALIRNPNTSLSDAANATSGAMNGVAGNGRDLPVVLGDAVAAGRVGQADIGNVQPAVLDRFKRFQNSFGASLPVMSGFRDPERNAKASGADGSRHMHGDALDLDISGLSEADRVRAIREASAAGFTGIGVYENSLHLDTGGRRAWGSTHHADSIPAYAQAALNEHLASPGSGSAPTAARAQGMTRSMPGRTRALLSDAAVRYGQDANALLTIAYLESGGNPNARNPSGAAGVLQFMPGTAAAYNLANPYNVVEAADAGARLLRDNRKALVGALGREPSVGELYLAHQQGAGGAIKLLSNPDGDAVATLGAAAVKQNGGRAGMTNAEFAAMWVNKADGIAGGGGVTAGPDVGGGSTPDADVVKAYRDSLTDRMKLELDTWDENFKRGNIPSQNDIASFAGLVPLVNDDKVRQRLTDMMQTTEFVEAVASQFPNPADQRKYLDTMDAAIRQDGADLATIKMRDAADAMVKRDEADLKADPFKFAQRDPRVAAAWNAAGVDAATGLPNPMSPAQVRAAVAVTAERQRALGVTAPQLLPKDAVEAAANAFTTAENENGAISPDMRLAPAASLIMSTDDPAQRHAIFQQLVKAGVPDTAEAAFSALARGDTGAARRLFQAATIDAGKLPKTQASTDADMQDRIQQDVFAPGKLGDVMHGMSAGATDLDAAVRDNTVLTNAVKLRIAQGQPLEDAVAGASKDLFGDLKVVGYNGRLSSGSLNVQVTAPADADQSTMLQGFDRLRPRVRAALEAQAGKQSGEMAGQGDAGAAGRAAFMAGQLGATADNIMEKGVWRNAGEGFAFVNPYTNAAIAGEDGKPLIFSFDDVKYAATAPRDQAEVGALVGSMAPPVPEGSPSSPMQPDANMGIRDALMGGPEQAQADLAAAGGAAPMPTAVQDAVDAAPAPPSLDAWTPDQALPDFSRYSPAQLDAFLQRQNRILDGMGR